MTTLNETYVNSLKINRLTKTQLNNATELSPSEAYLEDPEFVGGKLLETTADGDIVESSQTIPTVNNPTITITQGGVSKGSFTLNQSTGDTIALDAGGGGSVNTFDLFDHKWSDYQLNDQSWLRADTFSWQDGTVYSDAYNHLVADYNGGTSQTETIGSYTITYVLATDGHKITTDETTVANIYNESGVAWYYILDTTNQRFKLPREKSELELYYKKLRVVGNGKAMYLNGTLAGDIPTGNDKNMYVYNNMLSYTNVSTSSSGVNITSNESTTTVFANRNSNDARYKGKEYLYFYVGQFSQTATEQTAGLNSELFNGKMDRDMSNMNPSSSAKETIVGLCMPDYSTGVSRSWDTSYLADKDTVICYQTNHQSGNDNVEPKVSSDNSNWITLYGQNAGSSSFKVAGWFFCPKGWYWKMVGGRNVDRMLKSYIVKGEV